ncbi:HPr family phosphocarrier protein [Leifsonia sp. YIM 134122]|uniref:HPr family phosphocarrier protein n=1 Tax=Leifsonia stereocauli TaxID=3134136 RepID=A0ABU9W819_9MICO
MEDTDTTATRSVRIGSEHGLHARPAKLFTQAVGGSGAKVTIAKGDGKPVNAASILAVIALGIDHGDEVTVAVDGDDAAAVLDRLVDLLVTDHDS